MSGPAPPGVVTGARLFLLRQVAEGRVRWLTAAAEAWLITENGGECTRLFMELVRSGWARVVPWDMADATPAAAETEVLPAGEDVLIANRRKR